MGSDYTKQANFTRAEPRELLRYFEEKAALAWSKVRTGQFGDESNTWGLLSTPVLLRSLLKNVFVVLRLIWDVRKMGSCGAGMSRSDTFSGR